MTLPGRGRAVERPFAPAELAAFREGLADLGLTYRERALLGRDLKADEARYVIEMARRIAAILLLEPALDADYERVKAETCAWLGPSVLSCG